MCKNELYIFTLFYTYNYIYIYIYIYIRHEQKSNFNEDEDEDEVPHFLSQKFKEECEYEGLKRNLSISNVINNIYCCKTDI